MALERVASADALWEGEMIRVDARRGPLLLVKIDGVCMAYDDACPHLGLPLSSGQLCQHQLTCAGHGWTFDLQTGQGINPRSATLVRRKLTTRADGLYLDLEESE